MSVSYSFTTSLLIPASASWPCLDIGESSMVNILLLPEVSVNRGTPWVTIDGNNDLVFRSDDGIGIVFTIDLAISQQFSYEVMFIPSSLPTNLNALDKSRFFIAVFDQQDNAGGILLSQSGLAIVSSFGNLVMPIAGSQNLIPESNDYYTMRMVVDGTNNVMDLYITKTDELAITGHQLRYTTAAPITPGGQGDGMLIEVLGQVSKPVEAKFSEMHVNCSNVLVPNQRPIADTGRDQTASIGSVIQLDGTDSYDPEGQPITYKWFVVAAPENSSYRQVGVSGFTQDDLDSDGFTPFFEATGSPWSEANAPSLQPGDVLIVNEAIYIVSDVDWVLDPATGWYDRGGGFDDNKLRVESDDIPDNLVGASWDLYYQSTFFPDRTLPQPTFVPDVVGLYTVQLVVNDGDLDSLASSGLVNIAESNVPYGVVPDVNFIWDYLSDAWNLYDDRDPVTTIWSGFAQVAANVLLTAWQHDYSKSLVDVQRTFQRRWLNYPFLLEEPQDDKDDAVITLVRGDIVRDVTGGLVFSNETLTLKKDAGDWVDASLDGSLSPQEIADAINLALGEKANSVKTANITVDGGSSFLVLSNPSGLVAVSKDGTANATLGFSEDQDTQNDFGGENGAIGATARAFVTTDDLIDFVANKPSRGTLLVYGGLGYEIEKVALTKQLTSQQDLVSSTSGVWQVSSTIESVNTDFSSELVGADDIISLEVRKIGESSVVEVLCEATGARNRHIGFDPRPLLEVVGSDISDYEVSLNSVRRISSIPVSDLVLSIPRLQEVVLDPPTVLTQNRDYTISSNGETNGIHFNDLFDIDNPPPDRMWAEITFLDNKQVIENNFGVAVDFKVEDLESRTDDLDYLSAVRGLWYAFFNGPSLRRVLIGTQILLGLPFAETDGVIEDINLTFNATQIRMLIRDKTDPTTLRSYFLPRNVVWEDDGESMVAVNPATNTEFVAGDEVEQFAPLSKGVTVSDWVKDPEWWAGINNQGTSFLEIHKFFRFLVQADIDVFNITNLVFAIEFVKKIKPHYTFPLWVVLKRLVPTEIDVTDSIEFTGILHLFDDPSCMGSSGTGGSYRFDDTDESGNPNWAFDGDPLGGSTKKEFLYDKRRLCPEEYLLCIMSANHAGGVFPFDWIWAFDDGGGTDAPPLSGPLGSPPSSGGPYGSLVGVVQFDVAYAAGWYSRGKVL